MGQFDNESPFMGKVSPVACMGGRITRALCSCCGGSNGVRRAWRKADNAKPKGKSKRTKNHKYSYLNMMAL